MLVARLYRQCERELAAAEQAVRAGDVAAFERAERQFWACCDAYRRHAGVMQHRPASRCTRPRERRPRSTRVARSRPATSGDDPPGSSPRGPARCSQSAPTLAPDAPMLQESMTFGHAIDLYIKDMWAEGRITSAKTEVSYRACLNLHAEDVGNRDPRYTNRDGVKRTLRRWTNPNTQRVRRGCLVSFYDWAMQELEPGRKDNPARQTRAPRTKKPTVYRMTRQEAAAFMLAAQTQREQRIAYLGIGAGLRLQEIQGLQGRHFKRAGYIWISADIGKGGRERWIPVLVDLFPLVEDIRATVAADEYVIPAQRWRDPGRTQDQDGATQAAGVEAGVPHRGRRTPRTCRDTRAPDPAHDAARVR